MSPSVYAYCRVSSKGQDRGISFPVQIEAAHAYKNEFLKDIPWGKTSVPSDQPPGFFCERTSAFKNKSMHERPSGLALLRALNPGDHIIFYSVCRSFRNTGEFSKFVEYCQQNNITPHFCIERQSIDTPSGRLMLQMWAAAAEYYSAIISWRVREAKLVRKILGHKKRHREISKTHEGGVYIHPVRPTKETKPGRVFIYTRVSTAEQYIHGMSLEHQELTLRKYAERLASEHPQLTIHQEIITDEAVSSFKIPFNNRKNGGKLNKMLKEGDHVIVLRMDRAFRNNRDFVITEKLWRDRGVVFHLMDPGINTSTSMGRIQMQMLSTLAEMESATKSERNRAIARKQKEMGVPWGGIHYVCHKVVKINGKKRVVPDYEQFAMGLAACILRVEYHLKVDEIAGIMHLWYCQKHNITPTSPAARPPGAWRVRHVKWLFEVLPGFFTAMSEPVFKAILDRSLEILATPYDTKWCKRAMCPEKITLQFRREVSESRWTIALNTALSHHSSWQEADFRKPLAVEREYLASLAQQKADRKPRSRSLPQPRTVPKSRVFEIYEALRLRRRLRGHN